VLWSGGPILNDSFAEALSLVLLFAVLAGAVIRPRGWPEAVVAVPAAGVVIGSGAISLGHVGAELERLAPVVCFLAAVLVLAQLSADDGVFEVVGAWLARSAGRPRLLLRHVFVAAALTTAVLSLDATIVLLTPVVFAAAGRVGARPKPHVYACTHLSNTASLLLPVSNLTNLLAFTASGLSFLHFAGLMTLPWLVAIAVEYVVLRWFFAADLDSSAPTPAVDERPAVPVLTLVVLAGTLAGFALTSFAGIDPVWAAVTGAVVLGVTALLRRRATPVALVRAAALPFLAFVLALGIMVRAVIDNGVLDVLGGLIPARTDLVGLLAIAALAAGLANLVNNLPAVLVLLPLTAGLGSGAVLAVLLGANIGPNLTYAGSLATLLWRRIVHQHDRTTMDLGEFTRLGLLTVPASLALAVVALWVSLHVIGG
jgi:arsenical pump membrane protein